MPVCQAVCCRLKFALSQEEVEQGQVKWDIGHPYVIRQDSNGYCCHNDAGSRSCAIYNDRPNLCRRYSCRHDNRIWTDFEGMVLNTEWITEHLGEGDAILLVDAEDPPEQAPSPAGEPASALSPRDPRHEMIHDVDESLGRSSGRDALAGTDVEVVLDAPTSEWSSRRNSPTLDLYLYDIREDLRRRENGVIDVHNEAGRVTARRRPPRYFKLSYLVTAWTQRPEDEHRLLSAVLACFLAHDCLPADILAGRLAGTTLPIAVTVALPPPEDRALSDVWSALGGDLKPSLDLVVITPFEAGTVDLAAQLVLEGVRANFAITDQSGEAKPGGTSKRGRGKGASRKGTVVAGAGGRETVVGGTVDNKGRIFHLHDLTHDGGSDGTSDGGGD